MMRVCLVEDDAGQRRTLETMLQREGFDVESCARVSQAVDRLQSGAFEVAVLDLQLDDEFGLDVLRQLNGSAPGHTQFIVHTGYGTFESARDALNLGVFAFVEKLNTPSELITTVHRAAAEALQRSLSHAERELRFRARLLDCVQQAIVVTDLKGRVQYWNQFAEKLFGWSAADAAGRHVAQLMMPADQVDTLDGILDRTRTENGWATECEVQHRDGRIFPVEIQYAPVRDEKGKVIGTIGVSTDISERKAAERRLRQSEERFRTLAENTRAVPWVFSMVTGQFEFVGPQTVSVFGIDPARWREENFWKSHLHPADRQRVTACYSTQMEESDDFQLEYRMRDSSGHTIWVHDVVHVNRDESGRPDILTGLLIDITDQRKAQELYRIAQRAMESAPQGIVICDARDPSLPIISANEAFCKLTGYRVSEVLGRNCRFLQGEDRDQPESLMLKAAIRDGMEESVVLRNYRKDGTCFLNEVRIAPVVDDSGEVTHYVGFQQDMSARIEVERRLRLTQFAVDKARTAILWCHADGRFLYVNDIATEWLGYSRWQLLRMQFGDVVPEFPQSSWPDVWEELRQCGEMRMETVVRCESGETFPVEMFSSFVSFEGHEYQLTVVLNIADRKELEQKREASELEMDQMREEMARVARLNTMSEMAAGLAHELNQPISAIANYAAASQAILQESDTEDSLAEEALHYLETIKSIAYHTGEIVHGMSNFSQRSSKRVTIVLQELVNETLDMISFRMEKNNILVVRCFPREPISMTVEPVQIKQVVLNLVQNAIDSMLEQDEGDLKLGIAVETGDGAAQVLVHDSGIGIPDEHLPRLFESCVSSKEHGSGIGLAVSARIIRAHGGEIVGWNNPEGGATFRVTLPMNDRSEPCREKSLQNRPSSLLTTIPTPETPSRLSCGQ